MKHLHGIILIFVITVASVNAAESVIEINYKKNELNDILWLEQVIEKFKSNYDTSLIADNNAKVKREDFSPDNLNEETTVIVKEKDNEELKNDPLLEEFRIYPNPTRSYINVFLPKKVLIEYQIIINNSFGEEVVNRKHLYSTFPFRYNTAELDNGVYFVTIKANDSSVTRKIIVNR